MDALLAHLFGISPEIMTEWITPGRYVTGRELAKAGMAELIELDQIQRSPLVRLAAEGASTNGAAGNRAARGARKSSTAK